MSERLVLFALATLIFCPGLFAQTSKLRKANVYLENRRYDKAIQLYESILEKKEVAEAKVNLAKAYRKIKNYPKAEFWYSKIVNLSGSRPIHKYYYGMMLQRNGNCERAQEWFKKYLKQKPNDRRAKHLLNACEYQEHLMNKNKEIYQVEELSFNSIYNDLGPAYYYNGLVFASERTRGANLGRQSTDNYSFLDLYYTEVRHFEGETCGTFKYGIPIDFSSKINTRLHEAIVTFNEDESEIFYTQNLEQNAYQKGEGLEIFKLKIMHSKSLGDGRWQEVEELPFNSSDYSCAHPNLTPNGRFLFFSSNMPGGFGGKDIYVVERFGTGWGTPINLGPAINTSGDEMFPYYEASGRLYFSSDGHVGLGGQDIYFAEEERDGKWGNVQNIGYPINTHYDDFGIIFSKDGGCGYFTSDRENGTGGEDIYAFYKNSVYVQIFAQDEETGEPLEGAKVFNNCTSTSLETLTDGKLMLDFKPDHCCTMSTTMEGYIPKSMKICTNDFGIGDTATIFLTLERVKEYEISGYVFDQSNGRPIDGAVVRLLKSNCYLPDAIITDVSGRYYFELEENCCYAIQAEKGNFFTKMLEDIICTGGEDIAEDINLNIFLQPFILSGVSAIGVDQRKGMRGDYRAKADGPEKSDFIQPSYKEVAKIRGEDKDWKGNIEDFEESLRRNTDEEEEVYMLKIYYDFNRSNIRYEDYPELKKLLTLMKKNPKVVLEIGSHTDSRGDADFNQRLSQKRAQAVVDWLLQHGMESERLIAKGYGESQLVNSCLNEIDCTEQEHQLNRRTEFRVVGRLNQ